jgi:hypothetical protein
MFNPSGGRGDSLSECLDWGMGWIAQRRGRLDVGDARLPTPGRPRTRARDGDQKYQDMAYVLLRRTQ